MRLPRAGWPDEQDVLAAIEVLSLHEFEHLRLVDARPGREVELIEHLRGREPGRLEPAFRRLPLPLDQLQLDELKEERQVISVVGSTPLGDLLGLGQHRGQLQGLEVVLQQHRALGLGLIHDTTSESRAW
jgi:hypothetical protein